MSPCKSSVVEDDDQKNAFMMSPKMLLPTQSDDQGLKAGCKELKDAAG
jgi:hypothetical protein